MPHQLLLLRHAKSDWERNCSDFDRPLNPRGRRDAASISQWLHAHAGTDLDILSSPARRAAQTAHAVCAMTGIAMDRIDWDERVYLASAETLLEVLSEQPESRHRLLLIGHNPGLEDLLLRLAPDALRHRRHEKLLTTATLAWLNLPAPWRDLPHTAAALLHFVRPRDLPET